MPALHDTHYLQELVGEALARGCAATVSAQPNDPVEFLGNWLLRYVKNVEIVGDFANDKQTQLEMRKAQLEEAAAAAAKVKEQQETRKKAIQELAQTVDEPRALLQKAVNLIVQHTAAGAAYAAYVAEPEEPDWAFPEDPEDPAAAESDDEADPAPPPPAPEGDAANPDAAEAAAPAETEPAEAEPPKPKIPKPIDYSKKYLSYLAASSGQDFMLTSELTRPAPPPEDDPEAKVDPVPFTFKILDERRPMLYAPNASFEQSMRFFKGFPKIGAYQACGVQSPGTGEFKAVISADTLFPEAGGQALSQEDQDFIWHVSRALSQAFDTLEKQAEESVAGKSAQEAIDQAKANIVKVYNPPAEEPQQGEAGADAPAPAAEATETPAEDAADAPAAADGETGDDPISTLRGEIKSLETQLTESQSARKAAHTALERSQGALAVIKELLGSVGKDALPVLRHRREVPQATFHVLKAVLHVLGKDPETFSNWKRVFAYFSEEFVAELIAYDKAFEERDLEAWKRARCCYKALGEEGVKKLTEEFPDTHIGVVLLMWLKEVRKVARRGAAYKKAESTEETLTTTLAAKRTELEEAIKKRDEEVEAARKAAEEAAAAEAAAAAAEAAEGEGAEGEAPAEDA